MSTLNELRSLVTSLETSLENIDKRLENLLQALIIDSSVPIYVVTALAKLQSELRKVTG